MKHETIIKIIGLLRKDIRLGLTILDISKRLKIGYRPAYNHITSLSEEDIITVKVVGKAKQCFLNLQNSKCRHLLQEIDLLQKEQAFKHNPRLRIVLEGIISNVVEKFIAEIHSIVLFGSYAKGNATKTSDIDLLFIVADLKNKLLRETIEQECTSYQYSHNIKISPIITDIVEFKKMLQAIELNIGKEVSVYGIPIYGFEQFWRLIS